MLSLPDFTNSRTKSIIHGFQAFIIFLAWAMTIAVFTQPGKTDGRTVYYFILCWVSIPGLIYLTAVPMWPRLRKFGNVFAFALIDGLFTLLWFAAWIATATYVGTGVAQGGKDKDNDKNKDDKDKGKKSGCDVFAFGSPTKCRLSTGTTILAVFVFIIFIGTTMISLRSVMEYRRTGTMPYDGSDPTFAAHAQAAFSSNAAPHDFDDDDDRDAESRTGRYHGGPPSRQNDEDAYALLHNSEVDDLGPHGSHRPPPSYDPTASNVSSLPPRLSPIPPAGSSLSDYDTSYGGAYGGHRSEVSGDYSYNR
ncbi:hypothetical protein TEQG_05548 [Trichophyton equinum CBS 127.97]|uniref:MARVEL domain-containing protein n=1 Tax=Trichophyton equinum (strain ATCC MYA-4606 / CBS 127.97) TaxID=559882 RepID=F2PXD1_TRIEC|nr:hypothetical protein TEQG_05548 [Trichophyton equinum CBS 127.97]